MAKTTKLMNIKGQKGVMDMVDKETGEIESFRLSKMEERDFGFTKVWMYSFLTVLEGINGKEEEGKRKRNGRIQALTWIIKNANGNNQLPYTYREISKKSKVSLDTVNSLMTELQRTDFIRCLNTGCYIINPDIIFKGTNGARSEAVIKYRSVSGTDKAEFIPLEKQITELEQNISIYNDRLKKLNDKKEHLELSKTLEVKNNASAKTSDKKS